MFTQADLPFPEPEDFGLPADHGSLSVIVFERHRPGDELRASLAWLDEASTHESDRSVVLELRAPNGDVVDRAARAVGTLSEERLFEVIVVVPDSQPAQYVARLEIHGPVTPTRVFEWPVEVPDPTLPLAAELALSAITAFPGDELELTVRNIGLAPIAFGEDDQLERRGADGRWEQVYRDDDVLLPMYVIEPAASLVLDFLVPGHARPGRHRVVKAFGSPWARGTVRATVEFDVIARTSQ